MPCINSSNGCGPYYDGPFYDGPFPGAAPVNNRRWPCRPCGNVPYTPGQPCYGYYYQCGQLNITAGAPIPFNGCTLPASNTRMNNGVITLLQGGVYVVDWSMTVPAAEELTTVLSLMLNGATVPGSPLPLSKTTTANSMTVTNQLIISAEDCAQLSLVSSAAVDATAPSYSDVIASLAVHRL